MAHAMRPPPAELVSEYLDEMSASPFPPGAGFVLTSPVGALFWLLVLVPFL